MLPGIAEVLAGEVQLQQLRPLQIDDLLGREPVTLELPVLRAALEGRTVLITGRAGSIGSELARQVAANAPARLILLDQAESDLYFVELELKRAHPDLQLECVVGDILDPRCVDRVFGEFRPERVFHAAAENGCETFLLISTDKAVEPGSVMGATKRAAEPLTVTHPDVTRYFMTISEAVQLVLQASTLDAAQGRIAMLEMGDPVKIVELAKNMIRLSGLREGIDARIEFTGLRPGEKMHEVLSGEDETSSPTTVEKVRIVEGDGGFSAAPILEAVARMEADHLELAEGWTEALAGLMKAEARVGSGRPASA